MKSVLKETFVTVMGKFLNLPLVDDPGVAAPSVTIHPCIFVIFLNFYLASCFSYRGVPSIYASDPWLVLAGGHVHPNALGDLPVKKQVARGRMLKRLGTHG